MKGTIANAIDLAGEPDFALGSLKLRPSTREVVYGEAGEIVEPRLMQVLVVLARRRDHVVARDVLVEMCWGGRAVSVRTARQVAKA
jgi:DNA-binding winged helix-turn-helix (wHTH) protein